MMTNDFQLLQMALDSQGYWVGMVLPMSDVQTMSFGEALRDTPTPETLRDVL